MRITRRITLAALLAVASIGLTGVPASAEPSEWEFGYYPVSLHPGSTIAGGLDYLRTEPPNAIIGPTSRFNPVGDEAVTRLVVALAACGGDPGYSLAVFDSSGYVRSSTQVTVFDVFGTPFRHQVTVEATPEVGPGVDRRVLPPPAPTPGPRWLRVSCTQGETTPAHVAVCLRFTVDPSAPETWSPLDGRTRTDACPGPGRILGGLLGSWVELVSPRFFEGLAPGLVGPEASTTTTTRAPSGGGAPGGGGGGGGGASDTEAPDVSSVTTQGSECTGFSVNAEVLDNVLATSATLSWSGSPGSGSTAMTGGPSSWSGTIPAGSLSPNNDTLTVTVTAYDAAGNAGDGFDYIVIDPC